MQASIKLTAPSTDELRLPTSKIKIIAKVKPETETELGLLCCQIEIFFTILKVMLR